MRHTEALGTYGRGAPILPQSESVDMLFQADAAITVGKAVALDTSNTYGTLAVTAPTFTTTDHKILGIYTGEGGTGAETTVSGLKGRDAVTGDVIAVRVFGVASALFDSYSTAGADGDVLVPSVQVAGQVAGPTTTFDVGDFPLFTLLEAASSTNTTSYSVKKVFVRGV